MEAHTVSREPVCKVAQSHVLPIGRISGHNLSGDASPTWKAIEYGLDLLKEGIIWWVGSGTKIQIWRDPWINRAPSRKPLLQREEVESGGCHS
jgi:hypothetical protein